MPINDEVSIIVPSWRRPELLRACLKGVAQLRTQPVETIVVARLDDEPTIEVIKDSPVPARFVAVNRPGNVAPIIAGLHATRTPLVAIIDDDAVPRPDWLDEIVQPFLDPQVGCVGGHAPTPGGKPPKNNHPGRANWFGRVGVEIAQVSEGPVHEVDTVQECNWAWRTEVLRSVEFDPILDTDVAPAYGLDLTLNAKAMGWKVLYSPRAIVDHYSRSGDQPFREERIRAYVRNITLITLKHSSMRKRVAYLLWSILIGERGGLGVVTTVAELAARKPAVFGRLRASASGRLDGLRAFRSRGRG